MSNNQNLGELVKTARHIIELLGVESEISGAESEDGLWQIVISTEAPALLIGFHGKTLSSLQTLFNIIAYKKYGPVKVLVDVDGWRQRREETVLQIARTAVERVKSTGTPQPIYNLTPYERRIIHIELANDPEIIAESEGEGYDRHLVVKKK